MIDLIVSTVEGGMPERTVRAAKRAAFLAILEEEAEAGRCGAGLIATLRAEVEDRLQP
jgi:hypothetical protein